MKTEAKKLAWKDPEIDSVPEDVTILAEIDIEQTPRYVVCIVDCDGGLWYDAQTGSVGLHTAEDITKYVELDDLLEGIRE